MRNILLQKDKERLYKEHKLRIIVLVLVFLCFTVLIALFLLVPSYMISRYKESNTLEYAKVINKSVEIQEKSTYGSILKDTKIKLQLLTDDKNKISFADTIKVVIKNKAKGIKIDGFLYTKNINNKDETFVTGTASERGALLQFKKDLENAGVFSNVILPTSNLASDKDIKFSIKVISKF